MEHNCKPWSENRIRQAEMEYMQKLQKEHPLPTTSKRYCEKILEMNQKKLNALKQQSIELEKELYQFKKYEPKTNAEKLMAAFKIK